MLNVFKEIANNVEFDENFNVASDSQKDNWWNLSSSTPFDSNQIEVESIDATLDLQDITQNIEEELKNLEVSLNPDAPSNTSEEQIFLSADKLQEDIYTMDKSIILAGESSSISRPVTNDSLNEMNSDVESGSNSTPNSARKTKLFSRRKDVIIKSLLRKWRKFYLRDFNNKTNYLRWIKRKHGSLAYKTLLEDYITRVFQVSWNEKLLLFMGVFLYQQDLEDNLDLFVSPNFSPKEIKELLSTVHTILYKYSHQKFYNFSKNEEFKFVFTHFEKVGTSEVKKDREYELGLDLIKGQL